MRLKLTEVAIIAIKFFVLSVSTDFENAHIIGIPQTSCSSKFITLKFDTNVPFQGRISVFNKFFTPDCNSDYSANVHKNASFRIDISKCTDFIYLKNGSRILKAQVEIGFHPLVMTNNDRMFLIECFDNTELPIINFPTKFVNCTHLVRMATEWKSMTEFNVGDPIVHEWSCNIPKAERTRTFLTNCKALSQSGQIIHLIDENGCVIDSELMGDVVYNDRVPKLYARARIFKFLTDDKYRIECFIELCNGESSCGNRVFPPKCAYTKEEIRSRYFLNGSEIGSINPGTSNHLYDEKIRISSAWLTIKFNQYTETTRLKDRYHLKSYLNSSLLDITFLTPADHFLRGISFREPNSEFKTGEELRSDNSRSEAAAILRSSFSQPVLNPPLDSNEELIETITFGANHNNMNAKGVVPRSSPVFYHIPSRSPVSRDSLKLETMLTTTTKRNDFPTTFVNKHLASTTPAPTIALTKRRFINMPSASSLQNVSIGASSDHEKFVKNNVDWRFDDKAINDSDIMAEKQIGACVNATIVSTSKKHDWSGFEQLLFIWSFASIFVWIVLGAVFLYKYASNRPKWIGLREQKMIKFMESRMLSQDHPWLHADAFEERGSNKNEISINN